MAYDPDEMIGYRGKMIPKEVIFNKVKGMGWNKPLFSQLTDDEMIRVMDERKTPAQMGKSMAATFVPDPAAASAPKPIVDINSEEGSDPSVMGPPGTPERPDPPPPATGAVLESGIVATGIAPPSHAGRHLAPVDPTKIPGAVLPAVPTPQGPMRGTTGMAPPPKAIIVKPPRTDTSKLLSMLDAAFQLAGNDATMNTAKVLVTTNGLERAFQAMYPELAKKVLGRLDMTPDSKCRGGVVLDIEIEAEAGYVHIITSAGTITITGNNLIHKGAEQ